MEKRDPLNICILGGGNVGTLLAADLGRRDSVSVRIFTSRPDEWSSEIGVFDSGESFLYKGKEDIVSDNPEEVIKNADIIISTLPSHVVGNVIERIKPYISTHAWIGMMPGSGGGEFLCKDLIDIGSVFFGFQRVHGISRIRKYGTEVYSLGKKENIFVSAIPADRTKDICLLMEELLSIKCTPLANYLNVTLTPSNPILHTTRLYSLFYDWRPGLVWEEEIGFYDDWTDESSRLLLACDNELQEMCKMLYDLDLTMVKPLREHYESETPQELTRKIRSIAAFRGIKTPMQKTTDGFVPNFESRYFQEDFPYGLCIIKSFCDIVGVESPNIDRVLRWFEKTMGVEYYKDGKFSGRDLRELPLPVNYGISTIEDVLSYYG